MPYKTSKDFNPDTCPENCLFDLLKCQIFVTFMKKSKKSYTVQVV